jgi:acetyltransferase
MQVNIRPTPGRFRPEALFRPQSLVVIGADAAPMLARLRAGGFTGTILAASDPAAIAGLPSAADLAVLCDQNPDIAGIFAALAARGTFAALVLGMASGVRQAAYATGVRALGPGSFGLAIPALGLDATTGHLPPRPGRLALISQSAALCRAVLDWAEPNGVGFSHIIGIGGNADIGFALALDWLARDPGTGAILLDIRRIRSARLFLSAARAAAQTRPVVAIRAGGRLGDPDGDADAAFEAALRRAGVLGVATLEELLAAAETLSRANQLRRTALAPDTLAPDTLAIVTNAVGPALLAADAALREGVPLAALTQATRTVLALAMPGALTRPPAGAEVPQGVGDIVYCGPHTPIRLAEAAALLSGAPEVGGVLLVHAPSGPADAAGINAIVAAASAMKLPLLVCAMGETTGAGHRRLLAEARVPAFATPEQAVRGFAHLVRHRRSREAARELPSRAVMRLDPDRPAATSALARDPPDAAGVLAAYQITAIPGPPLLLRVAEDAMLGPTIAIGRDAPGRGRDLAFDLPPLNLTLARAQFARTRIATAFSPPAQEAVAEMLVRVSQLVVDFPQIETLDIALQPLTARLTLRPPGAAPARLAILPYPAELATTHHAGGEDFILRPIRPEDAEAHAEMFSRLPPEDVRYRFFSAMRELSAERMARMTQVDYQREMAFIATRVATGETVGVARLVRESSAVAGQGNRGEFAVVVQPDAKGKGLASALMRCLLGWARRQGITMVVGQVLADNAPMLAFVRHLGFAIRRMPGESDVVEAFLALESEHE